MKYNEFELGVLFERLGLDEIDIDMVLANRDNIRCVLEGLLEKHLRYTGVRVAETSKEIAKNEPSPDVESVEETHIVDNPTSDDYYEAMKPKEDVEKSAVIALKEEEAVEEIESTIHASIQKTPLNSKIKSADPDAFIIKAGDNFMGTTKNVAPSLYKDIFGDTDTTVAPAVEEYSKSVDAEIEKLEKEEEQHITVGDAWVPSDSVANDSPFNVVSDPFATPKDIPAPSLWTVVGTPNQGSEKEIKKEETQKKVAKSTADPDWMTTEW